MRPDERPSWGGAERGVLAVPGWDAPLLAISDQPIFEWRCSCCGMKLYAGYTHGGIFVERYELPTLLLMAV